MCSPPTCTIRTLNPHNPSVNTYSVAIRRPHPHRIPFTPQHTAHEVVKKPARTTPRLPAQIRPSNTRHSPWWEPAAVLWAPACRAIFVLCAPTAALLHTRNPASSRHDECQMRCLVPSAGPSTARSLGLPRDATLHLLAPTTNKTPPTRPQQCFPARQTHPGHENQQQPLLRAARWGKYQACKLATTCCPCPESTGTP